MRDNIGFGLDLRRMPKPETQPRVSKTADVLRLAAPSTVDAAERTEITWRVRLEHLKLAYDGVRAVVDLVEPTGSQTQVVLHAGATQLSLRSSMRLRFERGAAIAVTAAPDDVRLFARDGGARPT